ncbi:methyltransferase domain-containing protein [Egibacter rhizosphaerae]|uniref:Arsenite methyltransferase n=1 Tax=Egibacter rhizosphaerae TaxID=1670831 RepID=A0A411YDG6_9ACTN|nr:methyltransferase domain-containing protein [Egibacter rhizosphaerae]QBI19197.1 methyltransferase domain-containing protein [Egibacter rhizosphaerae]
MSDLMFQDEIRDVVRSTYRELRTGAGRAVAERFYAADQLDALPGAAIEWALGVGNPVRSADPVAGERVLDVGCGGGIDSLLAARRVGPTGRVLGVDALPEMVERAHRLAGDAGVADRCTFLVGEMEALPLPSTSVDVVISNGVLNLSPRKSRAIAEIARVLRPGGRLVVADLIVEGELPPEVLASGAAWAGCIAGALSEQVLSKKLRRAGLAGVAVSEHTPFGIDEVAAYPLFPPEVVDLMRRLIPTSAQERVAQGVIVRAERPSDPAVPAGPQPRGAQRVDGASSGAASPASFATTRRPLDAIHPDSVEAPGVTVRHLKRVEDDDVELKVLDVAVGESTPFHTHPQAHEAVMVSGQGRLRLSDDEEPLQPGDVFTVAPTDPHAVENTGSEPLRFVCMDCLLP